MPTVFTPHITSPKGGEIFNLGTVAITWDKNDPPTDDEYGVATTSISYELEYTENYNGEETDWHVAKRRIPWTDVSFDWVVGKMIKSDSVRIRMRARSNITGQTSDYSMSSGNFSVNVFKLIPPAIVSPLPNNVYTDFILIILDETLTRNTFNQKVRYTLEYASEKRSIDFTTIVKDISVGQNVIRWNLDGLTPSDDYTLRLTTKNASTCFENKLPDADQIAKSFVYDLKIQQPGMFIIDTKPPQAVLEVEGSSDITNKLDHVISVFAEDSSTDIEQIQLRECDASSQLALGNTSSDSFGDEEECLPSLDDILAGSNLGKLTGHSTKTKWTFEDKSGLRKVEALLTDSGGNNSLQSTTRVFTPVFRSTANINDFIVIKEQRDNIVFGQDSSGTTVDTEVQVDFEVAYIGTSSGEYWVLEPFPRLVDQLAAGFSIRVLFEFSGIVYLFSYNSSSDSGKVFRDDKSALTSINTFSSALSKTNAVAEFKNDMYIGLENGELWSYNGTTFVLVSTFVSPISSLAGDNEYLYIGFSNSSIVSLYNGVSFFSSDVEP